MYPILFEFGPFVISSFGVMMVAAFLICNYLMKKDIAADGYDPMIGEDITFRAAIGGIIGAKLYYLIENISTGQADDNIAGLIDIMGGFFNLIASIFTLSGYRIADSINKIGAGIQNFGAGLVFLGGLIGGMITVTYYIRKNNLEWLIVVDWVAPYLALGHAIGRIGCFLVGDCYGTYCTLPWGVTFPKGLPSTTFESFQYNYPNIFNSEGFQSIYAAGDFIYVHPTQLYESFIYTAIFFYLYKIRQNNAIKGLIMLEYLFLAGLSRFLIEFIRLNPDYVLGLSGAQFISLFMISVSTYFMYSFRKNTN